MHSQISSLVPEVWLGFTASEQPRHRASRLHQFYGTLHYRIILLYLYYPMKPQESASGITASQQPRHSGSGASTAIDSLVLQPRYPLTLCTMWVLQQIIRYHTLPNCRNPNKRRKVPNQARCTSPLHSDISLPLSTCISLTTRLAASRFWQGPCILWVSLQVMAFPWVGGLVDRKMNSG